MGLNHEGYVLLGLFAYALFLLLAGFGLYGRREREIRGGASGFWKNGAAYFGAGPLPLLCSLPALLLLGGWPRLTAALSLGLGCCLLPFLGRRLDRRLRGSRAGSVYELIALRFGAKNALPLLLLLSLPFTLALLSGAIALLARLFSASFSLAYNLAVYFTALLLLGLGLLSSPAVQRRWDRIRCGVYVLGLIALLFLVPFLRASGASPEPLPAGSYRSLANDLTLGLGVLGLYPLWHAVPRARRKRELAAFAGAQAALWVVSIVSLIFVALYAVPLVSGADGLADLESAYLLVSEQLHPGMTALLLLVPVAAGLGGGTLNALRLSAEEGLELLFPLTEGTFRRRVGCLLLPLWVVLALVPALFEDLSVYALFEFGLVGLAGCAAPLLLLSLGRARLRPAGAALSPIAGALAALLLCLLPPPDVLPKALLCLLAGLGAALPFLEGHKVPAPLMPAPARPEEPPVLEEAPQEEVLPAETEEPIETDETDEPQADEPAGVDESEQTPGEETDEPPEAETT